MVMQSRQYDRCLGIVEEVYHSFKLMATLTAVLVLVVLVLMVLLPLVVAPACLFASSPHDIIAACPLLLLGAGLQLRRDAPTFEISRREELISKYKIYEDPFR